MNILDRHEIFEIEAISYLNSSKLLEPLVFGGGTMLRLCYELNRYSADLDFWFIKKVAPRAYYNKFRLLLSKKFEITDSQIKFHTLLFEIRSKDYPERLKIEMRRKYKHCDFQERIAFSRFSTKQVILRAHTLEQTMKNKIEAALDRGEIRDFFDMEFLLRRGIPLNVSHEEREGLKNRISEFKDRDFKVTLGPVLEPDMRNYYIKNQFDLLSKKLITLSL